MSCTYYDGMKSQGGCMFMLVPVVCAGQKEKLWWTFFSDPSQWQDHRLEKVIVGIAVTIPLMMVVSMVGLGFLVLSRM
jgi:hypothetical protein